MKTYIYPENLRANVKLWFWSVRDFIIICGGIILSVVVLVNFWNVLPFAATACFAFLSLRVDETAIMDYIFNAVKFFLTSQQLFLWRKSTIPILSFLLISLSYLLVDGMEIICFYFSLRLNSFLGLNVLYRKRTAES